MLKQGRLFQFEVPDDWAEERVGNRFVFRGPRNQELIVSGEIIEGSGSRRKTEEARRRLFENAAEAANRAAAHPDLIIVRALARDEAISDVECWTLHTETRAGDVMFSEAVVVDPLGVLLVTFEAPNLADCLAEYGAVLKSIRRTSCS